MNPNRLIPILSVLMISGVIFAIIFTKHQLDSLPAQEAPGAFYFTPTVENDPHGAETRPAQAPEAPTGIVQDWGDLPPTQTAVAILMAESDAKAKNVAVQITERAVQNFNGNATATQVAIQVGTAQALSTAERSREVEQIQIMTTATQFALDTERQRRLTDVEVALSYTWKIGGSILAILAVGVGMIYGLYKSQTAEYRRLLAETSDNFLENIAPVTQINSGTNTVFEHNVAISDDERETLIRAAKELSGIFSRRRIAPKYFSEATWDKIELELLRENLDGKAYAVKPSRYAPSVLTDEGWKYLGLTRSTPPPEDKSIEILQDADNPHTSPPQISGEDSEKTVGK